MLAPYAEQRHAMIDLCGLPQAPAGLGAAPLLQPLEDARTVTLLRPTSPANHAGSAPLGVPVCAAIPQIPVPTAPVDRLTADATEARPAREPPLAIGRGRNPETCCPLPTLPRKRGRVGRGLAIVRLAAAPFHPRPLFIGEPPRPSGRFAALPRQRAGEAVCPNRMGPPIGIDREPRHRRRETPPQGMDERGSREHCRERPVESRQGLPVDLVTPF